jgi:hypothetical protein
MQSDPLNEERLIKSRVIARAAKRNLLPNLFKDTNMVGAGFGRRTVQDETTDEPALVVYVMRKLQAHFLPLSRRLPRKIYLGGDCIEVDVVETGPIYPLSFTAGERPAPSGISIGHPLITAGTLGCLVRDNTDGSLCILSNNHVLANQNAAAIGDAAIQPGTFDGGTSPADTIAALKRFVTINAAGNTVDCAIAQVNNRGDVIDQMKNNLMPIPSSDHPAVGLLFAGSCNRTIMNPIGDVVAQLNIQLTSGPNAIVAAEIGMNVEKVGRTTEYTSSSIKEIDLTVSIPYDFGNATFDNQIATAWMSDGGDSGSIVCRGGDGGNEDHCSGCGTTAAAEELLGVKLESDAAMAKTVRDKFLRQTRIGKLALDLFHLNEEDLICRYHKTDIQADDKAYVRKLYDKYAVEARKAFVEIETADFMVTDQHLRDAKAALRRAKKYMSKDEGRAADQLFEMAAKAQKTNIRGILAMLNDEKLLKEVQDILDTVPSIRKQLPRCDK